MADVTAKGKAAPPSRFERALWEAERALADERAFADRLVIELNRHGWGDFHYGTTGQEREVVVLVDEWMARRGVTERPDHVR